MRDERKMDVFDFHQVQIAKKTLRYSDIGAMIIGGMTKEQARDILATKAAWSQTAIKNYESRA